MPAFLPDIHASPRTRFNVVSINEQDRADDSRVLDQDLSSLSALQMAINDGQRNSHDILQLTARPQIVGFGMVTTPSEVRRETSGPVDAELQIPAQIRKMQLRTPELWLPVASAATAESLLPSRGRPLDSERLPRDGHAEVMANEDTGIPQYNAEQVELFRTIRPFARLTEYKLRQIRSRSALRHFPRYATVFREGSRCSSLIIMLSGQVQAKSNRNPGQLIFYKAGAYFGLEAIAFGSMKRDVTLEVVDDCEVIIFYAADLHGLHIRLAECRAFVVKNLFSNVAFFRGLSSWQCANISKIVEVVYDEGEGHAIFQQGAPSDSFAILLEGRVGLYRRERFWSAKKSRHVDGPDEFKGECRPDLENPWIGDTAFQGLNVPRPETARCLEPSKLLVVKAKDLRVFLANCHIANCQRFDVMLHAQRAAAQMAESMVSV